MEHRYWTTTHHKRAHGAYFDQRSSKALEATGGRRGAWHAHHPPDTCVSTEGSKVVENGSKMAFSKNDNGPFGVSLACSEAPLGRFDLCRVVCFTYPQSRFQTMHALQKEVNGVKW